VLDAERNCGAARFPAADRHIDRQVALPMVMRLATYGVMRLITILPSLSVADGLPS
jgi:hypothetical protein